MTEEDTFNRLKRIPFGAELFSNIRSRVLPVGDPHYWKSFTIALHELNWNATDYFNKITKDYPGDCGMMFNSCLAYEKELYGN